MTIDELVTFNLITSLKKKKYIGKKDIQKTII
jgi:hypothetical protein